MNMDRFDAPKESSKTTIPTEKSTPRRDDRRDWTRLPAEEGRDVVDVLLDNGEQSPALVDNMSFTGAKLTMLCGGALRIGDSIEVIYSGAPMKATVRFLEQADDTTWHVGLEWFRRKKA